MFFYFFFYISKTRFRLENGKPLYYEGTQVGHICFKIYLNFIKDISVLNKSRS